LLTPAVLLDWIPDEAQRNRVLSDNPARLYDFE
jgi:2-pyrone-4,6-dicarboxylate lactonase